MLLFSRNVGFGIMEPQELADLREIFDEACRINRMPTDCEAAGSLAVKLLSAVRDGIRDREALLELARRKAAA
jgi:hypothetical protein